MAFSSDLAVPAVFNFRSVDRSAVRREHTVPDLCRKQWIRNMLDYSEMRESVRAASTGHRSGLPEAARVVNSLGCW